MTACRILILLMTLMVSVPTLANEAQDAFDSGVAHLAADEVDDAVDDLEKAVKLDDTKSEYYLRLGEAYGRQAEDASMFKAMRMVKKVRKAFEKAIELDPENLDARSGLVSLYVNVPKIAGGGTDKARDQAEEIVKRDAQQGRLAFAQIYLAEDNEAEAVRVLKEASAADPDDQSPALFLGTWYTGEERYAEAFVMYEAFLAEHPDNMPISYQLGRTASLSGEKLDEGEAAFQRYLQWTPAGDDPGLDWANYRLGLIYEFKNQIDKARAAYQAALAINPDHPRAGKALKKLR